MICLFGWVLATLLGIAVQPTSCSGFLLITASLSLCAFLHLSLRLNLAAILYCGVRRCVFAPFLQNEVIPIPVQPTDTRTYIPTSLEMEEAVLAAESKGIHARMLLVTNPGNPLGTLYPEATLKVVV